MTTTDTNLQVINSMTQDKLNELKNSEGKIPSLANQLIMTDEDDVNVDCIRTEVVYDKDSSDSNINWGYTSGIQGAVEVVKDLTKYQYIDIIPQIYKLGATNTGGWSGVYRLDLTSQRVSEDWYVATYATAYADSNGAGGINNDVWKIVLYYQLASKTFKWLVQFNNTSYNNNANCVIAKIYGILKTPAMIYTGKELSAGDGISISNGVISSKTTSVVFAKNLVSTSGITATPSDFAVLVSGSFTKKSATSKLVILASSFVEDNSAGYGSGIRFFMDGEVLTTSASNSTKTHAIMETFSNISAGTHTIEMKLFADSGTAYIQPYNAEFCTILEVE